MGLVAPWHMESSWTRDWTHVPCIDRWFLNYWIIRKSYSKVYKLYICHSLASSNTTLIWIQCRNLTIVYLHFLFFSAISFIHFWHMCIRPEIPNPWALLGTESHSRWAVDEQVKLHLPFAIACITTWPVPHLSTPITTRPELSIPAPSPWVV